MSFFTLDCCPVELIFLIFKYLSGYDILYSFLDTSSYMNNILKSYDKYSINCISITRKKFDFIFSHIKINQIISIILSNGNLTGGQIDLFLSYYSSSFHLFTNLRYLTLHYMIINKKNYNLLIEAFKQFKNLRLLTLQQIKLIDIDDYFKIAFEQLNIHCLIRLANCSNINILCLNNRLQCLDINNRLDDAFYHQQWSHILSLKLNGYVQTSINKILCLTPQLISLIVTIIGIDRFDRPNFHLVPNLKQLIFSCENMTFDDLTKESGLHTLSKLKRLQIEIQYRNIDQTFLDGYQWEMFLLNSIPNLLKFDFYFSYANYINPSLITFRSQFWIENKKWFVALKQCVQQDSFALLTVPYFNTTINISREILATTSRSFKYFNSNVHYIIDQNLNLENYKSRKDLFIDYRYEHIERFDLTIQNQFDNILYFVNKLNSIFNLNSIKKVRLAVIFPWNVNYQQIFDILNHMPNLTEVILVNWLTEESWLQVQRGNSRISSIELPDISHVQDIYLSNCVKEIFTRLFSSIEHIFIRIFNPDLCNYFNKYAFPWKNLSSLQIKYIFHEDREIDRIKRRDKWKDMYLKEILPRQSRRNFTFTDNDENLNIWFGETINDENQEEDKVK